MFFDMQQHEMMINDNEIFNNFGRAPRHPPGKEGVVKMVGINFHLFLWLLSPIGGEAAYVVKMSE